MTIETPTRTVTQFVDAEDVRIAFRRLGAPGAAPLVILQHFRHLLRAHRDQPRDGRRVPRRTQGGDLMNDTQVSSDTAEASAAATVPLRLEVTVLGVSDVDRAKAFYQRLGWRLDADFPLDERFRIVQFTPPGSPASIQFGTGVTTMTPGSVKDMYLIVDDIEAARDELVSRGADVSEIWHGRGLGNEGHEPGPDPSGQSYGSFATFSDPDGNRYLLQEITERLPGRE
jgi:catechol 2,3-dioxygenase-like lactoylglutathione lyase family enzyme